MHTVIWYCILDPPIVVPGVPVNLTLNKGTNSSTVRVSWSSPLSENGIILDYQVHYAGYKTKGKQTRQVSISDYVGIRL